MLYQDAILKGAHKPCECNFNKFQVYLWPQQYRQQHSSDLVKEMSHRISGKSKFVTVKRWIADCPCCGKLWLASRSKKEMTSMIRSMGKEMEYIDISESIRYGSRPAQRNGGREW